MKIPPLRRNPDGRAFVEIPDSGRRRKYLGIYGTPEAADEYAAWVRQFLSGGGKVVPDTGEVVPIYGEYLKTVKASATEQVFRQARLAFIRFVEYGGAGAKVDALNAAYLRGFQKFLAKKTYREGDRDVPYSRRYVNDIIKRVKRFVRWGVGEGLLAPEVLIRVEALEPLKYGKSEARETRKVPPVHWEDVLRTLPFLNPTIQRMVQLQFMCGMRPGEVCSLERGEIDRKGITAADGTVVWLYVPKQHKGTWREQELIKAIPPVAQRLILEWESRGDCGNYLFSPRQATKDAYNWNGPWVIGANPEWDATLRSLKERYTNNIYAQAVRAGAQRARGVIPDIPEWTPNQLRHGMATLLRQKLAGGIEKASTYAGHKRIDTTLIYAHRTRLELAEIAAQFGKILEP